MPAADAWEQNRMRRSILIAAVLAAVQFAAAAHAGGPFDGLWEGGSPKSGAGKDANSCGAATATVNIVDGTIMGNYTDRDTMFRINGKVAADGSATGNWAGNSFSGRFAGKHFEGVIKSNECGAGRKLILDKTG
jgi:hypothetical protein